MSGRPGARPPAKRPLDTKSRTTTSAAVSAAAAKRANATSKNNKGSASAKADPKATGAPASKRRRRQNLTPSERAQLNRDRNREHARNTRLRKKAFVEELQRVLREYQEQEAKDKEQKAHRRQIDAHAQDIAVRRARDFLELLFLPKAAPSSRRDKKPAADGAQLASLISPKGAAVEMPVGIMLLKGAGGAVRSARDLPGRPDEAGTVKITRQAEIIAALNFTREYAATAALSIAAGSTGAGTAAGASGGETHLVLRLAHLQVAHSAPALLEAQLSPVPSPRQMPAKAKAEKPDASPSKGGKAGDGQGEASQEKSIQLCAKWELYRCAGPPPAGKGGRAKAARSPAKQRTRKGDGADAKRDDAEDADLCEEEVKFEPEPEPLGERVLSGFVRIILTPDVSASGGKASSGSSDPANFSLPALHAWRIAHASMHCDPGVAMGPDAAFRRALAGARAAPANGAAGAADAARVSSEDETLTTASASAPSSASDIDDSFLEVLRAGTDSELLEMVRKLRQRGVLYFDASPADAEGGAGGAGDGMPPLSMIVDRVRERRDTLMRLQAAAVAAKGETVEPPPANEAGAAANGANGADLTGIMVSVIPLEKNQFIGRVRLVSGDEPAIRSGDAAPALGGGGIPAATVAVKAEPTTSR
uniref:BZIP domain-containing protein n=1 Tax=Phaeomonas parva TaxID=124430 RepID=A0A6U4DIE7_9STRA|mmetsp:Transcript_17045/g.52327  ORF Transcript_17045/g.52327 Transcript_17045/m.52327 type:complete len:649 (+) Transcript_17045:305-2251(+)